MKYEREIHYSLLTFSPPQSRVTIIIEDNGEVPTEKTKELAFTSAWEIADGIKNALEKRQSYSRKTKTLLK